MADFGTPFANSASRRNPTSDEKINGFPCGPADQLLFNGLFYRLESEIGNVISYAGLTGSDADMSQLRQAIAAMIQAATGGGPTDSFILLSQASARLPIYPEVDSADGKINLTAPVTGTIRVPGNVDFMHRGISPITSGETDLATVANKTYHVRWNPVDGFILKDLADGLYNPGTLNEGDRSFDTTYDDMLVARVVTNSSNVATITSLANKHDLYSEGENSQGIMADDIAGTLPSAMTQFATVTLDWSRRPRVALRAMNDFNNNAGTAGSILNHGVWPISRYGLKTWAQYSGTNDTTVLGWEAFA